MFSRMTSDTLAETDILSAIKTIPGDKGKTRLIIPNMKRNNPIKIIVPFFIVITSFVINSN